MAHSRYLKSDRGAQLIKPSSQCRRDGGGEESRYKLLGTGGPERGPGPDHLCMFLSFSVV